MKGTISPSLFFSWRRLFQIGDTASLVKVGWLISPLGILLTGVGLFLIVSQEKKRGLLLLLGYALMETAVLLYGRSITPTYFWAARRDLPVFLPMSMEVNPHALWAFRRHASGALQWIAPSALSLALLAPQVKTSLPFLQHTEYAGASMSLSRLASIFPDDAVLLFDWTGAEHRYAAPMQYLYGRTSFFLPERTIRDPRLSMLVSRWQNEGRPVFWLASDDGSKLRLSGQALVYKTTYTSVLPEAEEVPGRLPARVGESTTVFDVYALVPGMERERKRLASVEIACDQQDGFYRIGNARTDAAPCWTKGSATIKLPAIRGHDLALVLRVGAGRPSGAPHGQTTVFLNDKKLADLLLPNPLHTYTLPIPAELQQSDQWTLRFETASWNPAGAGVSTDDVDFGMMIQSIAIEGR
ncbi:MAG: hypothetical protein M1305_02200 [Candidatus Marsarchaeota archaeon]|nr:hypothetical protein [Candidatus Marsarchaeota archaeon]